MKHHCHWPGCPAAVPPKLWGCKKHWYMLPIELRNQIWATYKPGQEITKTPSREYMEVVRKVRDWILANHQPEIKPAFNQLSLEFEKELEDARKEAADGTL